jgi:hypothetical protein
MHGPEYRSGDGLRREWRRGQQGNNGHGDGGELHRGGGQSVPRLLHHFLRDQEEPGMLRLITVDHVHDVLAAVVGDAERNPSRRQGPMPASLCACSFEN